MVAAVNRPGNFYFTSDLHLGHKSILHLQNRPFADIEEMNDAIIHNINDSLPEISYPRKP